MDGLEGGGSRSIDAETQELALQVLFVQQQPMQMMMLMRVDCADCEFDIVGGDIYW